MNSKIQVHIRIRPSTDNSTTIDGNNIIVGNKTYTFDIIYDSDADQTDIFSNIEPLLGSALEGYNATIFAYGQTGSGKTYTMGMSRDGFAFRDGVVPRSIAYLFERRNEGVDVSEHEEAVQYRCSRKNNSADACELSMSFIEIYNEDVKDLLGNRANVFLREVNGEVQMAGVKEIQIESLDDAFSVLGSACGERTTKSTRMNSASSRSHAILTINMKKRVGKEFMISHVRFVDLAGSERVKRAGVPYVHACPSEQTRQSARSTMRESIAINSGLLALGNVISALSKKMKHIPFRDSKLTRLLQASLTGNYNTLMIACISPSSLDTNETQNTLKYALRATNISMNIQRNVTVDFNRLTFMELKKEIINLKEENKKLREKANLCHLKSRIEFLESENKNLKDELERTKKLLNCRKAIPISSLGNATLEGYGNPNPRKSITMPRYSIANPGSSFANTDRSLNRKTTHDYSITGHSIFNRTNNYEDNKRKMPIPEPRKMRHSVFVRTPYALHTSPKKCIKSETINKNILHKQSNVNITSCDENSNSDNWGYLKKHGRTEKTLFGSEKYTATVEQKEDDKEIFYTAGSNITYNNTNAPNVINANDNPNNINNYCDANEINANIKNLYIGNSPDDLGDTPNENISNTINLEKINSKINPTQPKEDRNELSTTTFSPIQIETSEYLNLSRNSISNIEKEDRQISLINSIASTSIQSITQYKNSLVMGTLDGYLRIYDFVKQQDVLSFVEERTIKSLTSTVCINNKDISNDCNDLNHKDKDVKDLNEKNQEDIDAKNIDCKKNDERGLNEITQNYKFNYGDSNLSALLYSTGTKLKIKNETDMFVCSYNSDISAIAVCGNYIFTGHEDGSVQIRDMRMLSTSQSSDVKCRKIQIHKGTVFDICFLHNEIYTASRDHTVGCIKMSSSQYAETDCINTQAIIRRDDISGYKFLKTTLRPPHYDSVHVVLPYRNSVISAGRDCSIKRWIGNRVDKTIPYAHDAWIRSGCVFDDSFVTGCKDGIIMIWEYQHEAIKNVGRKSIDSINCMVKIDNCLAVGCQKSLNILKIS